MILRLDVETSSDEMLVRDDELGATRAARAIEIALPLGRPRIRAETFFAALGLSPPADSSS